MAAASARRKLGGRIAASRRQRGLSQSLVARRAEIAPSYLSRIETGKVHPTVETARRIAAALRVSLDELVGPSPSEQRGRSCPVSPSGHCLLDLVVSASDARRAADPRTFTPRQLRLLRRFAALVRRSNPRLLRFLEVLVGEVLEGRAVGET